MRQVNRVAPVLPVGAMQTYSIDRRAPRFWRKATCEEVACPAYAAGWATTVAAGSDDEAVVRRAGRRFTVEAQPGGFLRFVFGAGQPCFRAAVHRVPVEREPLYVVRGGDWRAGTGVIRRHVNGEDWVDDFANHQNRVARRIERG